MPLHYTQGCISTRCTMYIQKWRVNLTFTSHNYAFTYRYHLTYQIHHDKGLLPSQPLEVLCQEFGVQGGHSIKLSQWLIGAQRLKSITFNTGWSKRWPHPSKGLSSQLQRKQNLVQNVFDPGLMQRELVVLGLDNLPSYLVIHHYSLLPQMCTLTLCWSCLRCGLAALTWPATSKWDTCTIR